MALESVLPPNTLATEALLFVIRRYRFSTVLDVGSGAGAHAACFRAAGKTVTTISLSDDYGNSPDRIGDFLALEFEDSFELVWCSHVLEHQRNVGLFLNKVSSVLRPGGVLAITVPPSKQEVVGGHLTIWNAGLLLYNLVLAGFDCSEASVLTAGYNVSVVVRARKANLPQLRMDEGDIERLQKFFPLEVKQGFDGRIDRLNWDEAIDDKQAAGPELSAEEVSFECLNDRRVGRVDDMAHLQWCCRLAPRPGSVAIVGANAESAGVVIAEEVPDARILWLKGGELVATDAEAPIALVFLSSVLDDEPFRTLENLNRFIAAGTVLAFRELFSADAASSAVANTTWRAIREWMAVYDRRVRPLAAGPLHAGSFVVSK